MKVLPMIKALFASAQRISPADCAARVRSGEAILIDVREPSEWARGVVQSARRLSLTDLVGARTQWKPFLAEAQGRELLLYCAVGGRSGVAARILVNEGFRAANAGAITEWTTAGWPLEKEPSAGS